jgi:hypothetical protein
MQIAWLSLLRSLPGVDLKHFSSKGQSVSRGRLKRICRWEVVREALLHSRRVNRPAWSLRLVPCLTLVEGRA